ncbi:MAG: ribonuclease HII [Actinomycetota bacterium]|nr:ribonuclease HII [Actinomycetota bacterium]
MAPSAGVGARTTLRLERRLLREGPHLLASMDEVGRGALGGPVTVGVVLVDRTVTRALPGVRDSKLLSPGARERLVPRIRAWAVGYAVGHASAVEIDEVGIIGALRRAGLRALAGLSVAPDAILLDGSHDWLSALGQGSLFDDDTGDRDCLPPVTMRVKADLTCASVAAASILAKTERDAIMVELAHRHPEYGWAANKGYAAPEHIEALRCHGPTVHHRQSWRLPVHEAATVDSATPP